MTADALPLPQPALGPLPSGQPPHRRSLALVSNEEVAPAIHVLTFDLPPTDPLYFLPGQYVTFYLQREGRSVTRSYSIFSSAERHERVSLLVKEVPHGFASTYLCELSPAARPSLMALAPLGRFVLQDPGGRIVVLVATGVGLAPFVPMLELLRRDRPETPVWLFLGNRYAAEMVYHTELRALSAAWPTFHFVPVISRPPADGSWKGAVGHVEEAVSGRFPDLSMADVYICGSNPMVSQMQALSLQLKGRRDRIFVDRWGESEE